MNNYNGNGDRSGYNTTFEYSTQGYNYPDADPADCNGDDGTWLQNRIACSKNPDPAHPMNACGVDYRLACIASTRMVPTAFVSNGRAEGMDYATWGATAFITTLIALNMPLLDPAKYEFSTTTVSGGEEADVSVGPNGTAALGFYVRYSIANASTQGVVLGLEARSVQQMRYGGASVPLQLKGMTSVPDGYPIARRFEWRLPGDSTAGLILVPFIAEAPGVDHALPALGFVTEVGATAPSTVRITNVPPGMSLRVGLLTGWRPESNQLGQSVVAASLRG